MTKANLVGALLGSLPGAFPSCVRVPAEKSACWPGKCCCFEVLHRSRPILMAFGTYSSSLSLTSLHSHTSPIFFFFIQSPQQQET